MKEKLCRNTVKEGQMWEGGTDDEQKLMERTSKEDTVVVVVVVDTKKIGKIERE